MEKLTLKLNTLTAQLDAVSWEHCVSCQDRILYLVDEIASVNREIRELVG